MQEDQGDFALTTQLNKVRAFLCRLAEQNAVVAEYADRVTVYASEAANQSGAEQGFKLVEFGAVDHTGNNFAHVVGLFAVFGYHAVNVFGVI